MRQLLEKIHILIPVFNDWESLYLLFESISTSVTSDILRGISFTIVNDGSMDRHDQDKLPKNFPISIIELSRNMGSAKAIAIGLAYLSKNQHAEYILVMDADGEDCPDDIEKLVTAARKSPGTIIFGKRARRHEGIVFIGYYIFYKILFYIFTGKTISFGNFCIFPESLLQKLVHVSDIWNHFSGGIIRSKLPYKAIPLERGKRLQGKSRMNFTTLVLHGLSSIAVNVDIVAIRLLVFTFALIVFSLAGISIVTAVRVFTDLAIPGWATYAVIGLANILLQAFLLSMVLAFIVLHYRTQRLFIPAIDYEMYILNSVHFNKAENSITSNVT